MRKAGKDVPADLLPKNAEDESQDDLAAVAYALYLSGRKAPFAIKRAPLANNTRSAWRWSHVVYQN